MYRWCKFDEKRLTSHNTLTKTMACPEQFFMVLKKMGVESRMVRYVDDGHGIRKKPGNHLDSMRGPLHGSRNTCKKGGFYAT